MALLSFLNKLSRRLVEGEGRNIINSSLPVDNMSVEELRMELQAAQSLFDHVLEKDLIDHAIYKINAAERRMVYLLRQAQKQQACEEKDDRGGYPGGGKR